MPLNYDKWANLELSDDSDIEVHPNVDKKSFIKWKQQDIHQKREERKATRERLGIELQINQTLLPRIQTIISGVTKEGPQVFSAEVARLGSNPSPDKPQTKAKDQPTYDEMMQNLFIQVWDKSRAYMDDKDKLAQELISQLSTTEKSVVERNAAIHKEIADIDEQEKDKITSEGIRTGFDSSHVNKIADDQNAPEKKQTTQSLEVLNPGAGGDAGGGAAAAAAAPSSTPASTNADDLPDLSPNMARLAQIPLRQYKALVEIIAGDRSLLRDETTDALFVEAFNAGMEGKQRSEYAMRCVNAGLFVQYCNKLGKDGLSLFMQRLTQAREAEAVFMKDVQDTHARIMERSAVLASQSSSSQDKEQIQLMSEGDTTITFDVPEGPAPENIVLEGDGKLQQLDPETVKQWLNERWNIFNAFDQNLKDALQSGSLDSVNKYLGDLPVSTAEKVVKDLDRAGILNFSSSEIRDETV
ncbi:hypothetical protein E3P99_02470 [Wallemia hederae]|uniref:Hsp90 chaperone protein kinase-targeting subunit n=1 Tax=Wallemia hederae TaxID=1540922 RepID=A0A4T0FKC6_9BASI|nr:hypothetical protein E3P99_02470 [Wallemia hederae]